ncbi:hypothetical protein AB4Y32_26175 [Paraburkholderia phymatum]|uniref:Uncharacterized protein n=1 Tax=Paraburkholderia phymatum TaxID=148447 RepID=A0ACC6U6P1_9BURK
MFDTLIGVVMKGKSLAVLLVACASTLAVPSFAGGYGSASSSSSSDYSVAHAPVSHHVQTVHTGTMRHEQGSMDDQNQGDVGGDEFTRSQSGHRDPSDTLDPMYHGG